MTLYERLIREQDEGYRAFQTKLVPNIPPETILGVRTPQLRTIAKEVFQSGEREAFLRDLPHRYYEENLIHFFVLSMVKDFESCVREVEAFLPYVDCWPVSDQATPKAFRKNHEKLLPYVKKWTASEQVYTARYLKMMVAWYFATALAKRYEETLPYLEEHKLEDWVHKKAIQKALESYRVTDEHKEYLKSLR